MKVITISHVTGIPYSVPNHLVEPTKLKELWG
jgi:hypothetical protein